MAVAPSNAADKWLVKAILLSNRLLRSCCTWQCLWYNAIGGTRHYGLGGGGTNFKGRPGADTTRRGTLTRRHAGQSKARVNWGVGA